MRIIQYLTHWDSGFSLTGLAFLYVFAPLMALAYWIVPPKSRGVTLLLVSVLFCLLAEPASLALLAASVLFDWGAVCLMRRQDGDERARRQCMLAAVAKGVAVLCVTGILSQRGGMPLLLGTVVCALSGMTAVLEMYRRETPYEQSPVRFALFCLFFPRLYAGPLSTYASNRSQEGLDRPDAGILAEGFGRYTAGVMKAGVFGSGLAAVYLELRAYPAAEATVLSTWLMLLVFALALYYLLAGFSEMARGISGLLGFTLPQNFYYPYQSRSVTDFFERFLITVTRFIRRALPDRSGGEGRGGPGETAAMPMLWGVLLGLWFGFRFNNLVWGAWLTLFVLAERCVYPKLVRLLPTLICRLYALCVVLSSFTILSADSLGESARYIRDCFAFFTGRLALWNDKVLYLVSSNWLLLALGCFFATNVIDITGRWIGKAWPRGARVGGIAVSVAVLLVYTALAL